MSKRIDYAKASPEGYKAFGGVYVYLQKSGLSPELVYLVYLRVSQMNGCAYCIDMHSRDLLKLGVAVDKLVLVPVWRDAGQVFSARERSRLPGQKPSRAWPKPAFLSPIMKPLPANSVKRSSLTLPMPSA